MRSESDGTLGVHIILAGSSVSMSNLFSEWSQCVTTSLPNTLTLKSMLWPHSMNWGLLEGGSQVKTGGQQESPN